MPHISKSAELEALLFLHGEPVALEKVGKLLDLDRDGLKAAFAELIAALAADGRGLTLIGDRDPGMALDRPDWASLRVQLATKPELSGLMARFVKDELEEDLTPAALEALSLILYLGPIPRSRIDYLRGVNSSFIVRNLLLRGLVERHPDPARPHIYLYQATLDALKHLGVSSPEELPEYTKFRELASMDIKADPAPAQSDPDANVPA